MPKKPFSNPKYVPIDLVFGINESDYAKRLTKFINKNNIVGNLSWDLFYDLDTELANEIKDLIKQNKDELDRKYTVYGGNIEKMKSREKLTPAKMKKVYKVKSKKEKVNNANSLITQDLEKLGIQELTQIITYGGLAFVKLEPYYKRLTFLRDNPTNYIKPNYIKTAQGLLTFNFGKKANPLKWVDNNEIIMSRLYSAKMGIQYLNKTDKKALNETMASVKEKLDEVLDKLGFDDINDIDF